jgi:aldose 1-epimerase
MNISQAPFGTADGLPVELFTLRNRHGLEAQIMTYGGTLVSLQVPDRRGRPVDVVLGFEALDPYPTQSPYFGALIGRYGNRIARGRFVLDGRAYSLACNNGPNHLHGGLQGFDKVVWQAHALASEAEPALELRYLSPDSEEGYPGNLSTRVVYTLADENALRIDYEASTDRATILNLTQHSYFNLADAGDILDHQLELRASHFLPIDTTSIPTGERRPVAGTAFDFRAPTAIGQHIHDDDEQLRFASDGYDHCWLLDRQDAGEGLALAARLFSPTSGITLEMETTQPGVQFYSGNFLDGSVVGKGGWAYPKHAALCLEAQHLPDSPNRPEFPSTVLRPGEVYRHTTLYRFVAR